MLEFLHYFRLLSFVKSLTAGSQSGTCAQNHAVMVVNRNLLFAVRRLTTLTSSMMRQEPLAIQKQGLLQSSVTVMRSDAHLNGQ